MNIKNLLRITLLGFLAVAVVLIVKREMTDRPDADAALSNTPLPANGLVAYYFHGDVRCPTCRTIESYAKEALTSRFSDELASGAISWRVVNYETLGNAHFADEYEIAAPTVVLVRREAGKDAQWQNLSRVWELVGDKPAFVDYVAQETAALLPVK